MTRSPISALVLGLLAFLATPSMSQTPANSNPGDVAMSRQGPGMAGTPGAEGSIQEADYANRFAVFTRDGEPATLEDVAEAMDEADAVLVGEIHTDPVGHWIEAELVRRALGRFDIGEESGALRPMALSMEMFERDVQEVVNEYLADLITESQFMSSARPWEYYATDYRPMVELAKGAGVPVLAANAPRRYVNRVSRLGRESLLALPPRARSFLPPLPYPPATEAYREEWTSLMTDMPMEAQCEPPKPQRPAEGDTVAARRVEMGLPGHPGEEVEHPEVGRAPMTMPTHAGAFMENGLQAQSLWDASMAYAVTTFLEAHPGALVLHVVGGFHVQNFTGIPEAVQFYRPGTRTVVVSMDTADDFQTFNSQEYAGRGDFIILTDKSLDLNYERNCLGEGE